jgi:uncharacterized protein YpmB
MLMQSQNQPVPATNSDPNYNFIFNDPQKSKRRFRLPGGNNLTKITILAVAGCAILGILIIVLSSIFNGDKVNTKQLTDVAARSQEIITTSDIISQQSKDVNTTNLATTTSNVLGSEQEEVLVYLKKNHKKILTKDLDIYVNKKVDAEIQDAAQNNRLSEYYSSYLKSKLTTYQASVKTAYDGSSSAKLKAILQDSYSSTKTILSAPQLASAKAQ